MYLSSFPQLLTTQQAARGELEYVSNYALSLLTPRFYDKDISAKIKAKFNLKTYFWQVSVVVNIIYYKKDIFVIADINVRKNLTYRSISKITRGIVLVISLTIALIEDQT